MSTAVLRGKGRAFARKDAGKERVFKGLATVLFNAGIQVRREKLRQGHGWKAVSGACRARSAKMILVDSRLPLDEQVAFLASQIRELGLEMPADLVKS